MDFNEKHPELRPGEMLILNEEENSQAIVKFTTLPYSTKRLGEVAYGYDGNKLPGMKPIFVSVNEFESKMNKTNTAKAYLVGVHPDSFRRGEAAEIVGVVYVHKDVAYPRACYQIIYPDGKEDLVVIFETIAYQIISDISIDEDRRKKIATILAKLPPDVLNQVEINHLDQSNTKEILRKFEIDLSVYFSDINDPNVRINFTANQISAFFESKN